MGKQNTGEIDGEVNEVSEEKERICFVIMPISDADGYPPGHFQRVYDGIIKPACTIAGFKAIRADESKSTNVIIIDILQQILSADMAVCDISSKNGNVFYELGIRQAFDKPVTLMKDERTDRLFDTNTIREVPYDSQLRYDQVTNAISELAEAIKATDRKRGKELNSLVGLLQIGKAVVKPSTLDPNTQVILDAINRLSSTTQSTNVTSDGFNKSAVSLGIILNRTLSPEEVETISLIAGNYIQIPVQVSSNTVQSTGNTYISIKPSNAKPSTVVNFDNFLNAFKSMWPRGEQYIVQFADAFGRVVSSRNYW